MVGRHPATPTIILKNKQPGHYALVGGIPRTSN
jgi:hypothetical protein